VLMKSVVVQGVVGLPEKQEESIDVCIVPGGSGTTKYPCILPVIPAATVPGVFAGSHAPGLGPAFVMKLPSLNCSTTRNEPSLFWNTVKCRLNVSVAQSGPHVPESPELLP
jgi:hypothetical protein